MSMASAINAVDNNASEAWKKAVDDIILDLANTRRVFNSDDIWEQAFAQGVSTHEHRAMGPRITAAVKAKTIKIAGCTHCGTKKVMVGSRREEAHQMDIPLYESLIYGG